MNIHEDQSLVVYVVEVLNPWGLVPFGLTGPEGSRSKKRKVAHFVQNAPAQNDLIYIQNALNCTHTYMYTRVRFKRNVLPDP